MASNDIIDIVNDLIETCKDGEYGFRTSADVLKNSTTQQAFMRRAEECHNAALELQALVTELGGKAEDTGTTAGAMHRGWVAVKGTLTGYSDLAILEEVERGEDSALKAYRQALDKDLPPTVRAVIEGQYQGVKRNHDQMRSLRDQERTARA
jgi:uncharacterized protein (TIGR02284 family)